VCKDSFCSIGDLHKSGFGILLWIKTLNSRVLFAIIGNISLRKGLNKVVSVISALILNLIKRRKLHFVIT
jgi:hypothetical protein